MLTRLINLEIFGCSTLVVLTILDISLNSSVAAISLDALGPLDSFGGAVGEADDHEVLLADVLPLDDLPLDLSHLPFREGYMSLKRSEKALRYIDDILSIDDRNRDAHILKKDILMSMEPPDYEGACGQCEKIISYYPEDAETLRDLAILYSKMHKDQESLDAYRRSLSIKEDPKLFMEIITSLAKEERYDDVVVIANEYDDVYGNSVDMWAIKGNAEYSVGKYDDAIESYTKAVEIDHNKPILWHSKGMAEEAAGEYELAEISFDKAVLMDLDNPMYWISKSAVQEKKGDYAGAINSLNRVISTHPDNVYSLMHKATILVRLGRIGEARTFIELASKTEPLNMKIMVARRDIYYRQGDTEATKAVCKNILSINPLDKKTAITLAQMHFKTGDLDEARTVLVGLDIDKDGFSDEDYEIHTLLRADRIDEMPGDLRYMFRRYIRFMDSDEDLSDLEYSIIELMSSAAVDGVSKIVYVQDGVTFKVSLEGIPSLTVTRD